MSKKIARHYTSDFATALELRVASLQALIANLREEKFIRECLREDSIRLLKQVITGKRIAYKL